MRLQFLQLSDMLNLYNRNDLSYNYTTKSN